MTPSTVGKSYTHVCTAKPHTVFGAAIVVPIIQTVSANKNVAIFCAGGCFNVTMCFITIVVVVVVKNGRHYCLKEKAKAQQQCERLVNSEQNFTINCDGERCQLQLNQANFFHFRARNRFRSSCIPPVNAVPHGGQIIVHSTCQHSTTWWSNHRAFHLSTQYHMVVKSSCIPPVNTVPHGGLRSSCIPPVNTVPHGGQIESL